MTAIAVAALLLLLTQELLPWAIRQVIAERGVEVGRVDVSLVRQEVSIENLSLTSTTGGALRSLRFRSALATIQLAELARGRVALAEVSVVQPRLEVGAAHPDSERSAPAGAQEHTAFSGWPVQVDQISISDARLHARISETREVDLQIPAVLATDLELLGAGRETPWRLAGLSVDPSRALVSRDEGEHLSVSFSGKASNLAPDAAFPIEAELTRDDATLTLSGLVQIGEPRIDGNIVASQVELAPLLARVDRRVPVTGGRVSGRLAIAVAREADGRYGVRLAPVPDRQAERAIEVEASGVGGDPVHIAGQVSPEASELSIQGQGDSLVRYSSQVAARTGLEVVGGTGSLDSTVRIDPSEIRAPAQLVLSQLELKSEHSTFSLDRLGEMPLAVALALLTDAGGDIVLDLDLAFGREEIGVDWLSLFSAGLQRSLVRATTTPLRLIGALTANGAMPEAPATWLGFVPGRASLSEEGRRSVQALVKVAIALDARSVPGTPETPGLPQPEDGQSAPAVAAPPR